MILNFGRFTNRFSTRFELELDTDSIVFALYETVGNHGDRIKTELLLTGCNPRDRLNTELPKTVCVKFISIHTHELIYINVDIPTLIQIHRHSLPHYYDENGKRLSRPKPQNNDV